MKDITFVNFTHKQGGYNNNKMVTVIFYEELSIKMLRELEDIYEEINNNTNPCEWNMDIIIAEVLKRFQQNHLEHQFQYDYLGSFTTHYIPI